MAVVSCGGDTGRQAREKEKRGASLRPGLRATIRRARRPRPLALPSLSRSGLGGPGGARGPGSASPLFLPPSLVVPGGWANERREEGSGKRSALGRGPPTAPVAAAPTPSLRPESLQPFAFLASPLGPGERGGRAHLGAATHGHSVRRAPSGAARAGAGAAASRRCRMAAAPPSSLSYRTTGSTCLHPLSELLGIPLDQVGNCWRPGRGRA